MSQLENAKTLHQEGQLEEAIKAYAEILDKDPNNDEAHFGMAHANSRTNHLKTALAHAKEAVKLSPNSERYLQFEGQMLLANNDADNALKSFKKSLQENPNLFYSYLAIGDIYAIKNESKKAKENYKLALKVHNDGIPATVKLARLLILEGDYSGAEDILNQAELQFPTEPNLKLHMGIMRLEQGQDGFAELYFKKLLEDQPDNHVAKAYLSISLLSSDQEQAFKLITEMIEQQIQIPELMVALGMMYVKTNSFDEAMTYLQPICQSGLAYPSWLMALAHAFIGNSQPNSAQAVLQEILQRGENSKALLMLGQIHQVNKNYKTAIKIYQRVDENSSDYNESLIMIAECLYSAEQFSEVLEKLEPLLKDRPDHNSAVKLKLNALSQLNKYDEALALIDSIDSNKQTPNFNQLMSLYAGLLLDAKQNYEEAWQHFEQLKAHKPFKINLLTREQEKVVQSFESQPAETLFKFVFTDPATGHHDFINWLLDNDITPLIDRFNPGGRKDVFSEEWTVEKLNELDRAQIHFLRKKYIKQLNLVISEDTQSIADFIPLTPINMAVIKRIFPKAQVLVLNRNFADLRLHNRVFGSFQVHYSQFVKIVNQMIAMNPNLSLVDIDEWHAGDETAVKNINKVFGSQVKSFKLADVTPLDRLMFPHMHWKNYQQQLNK